MRSYHQAALGDSRIGMDILALRRFENVLGKEGLNLRFRFSAKC
jgi:hypothetical protein